MILPPPWDSRKDLMLGAALRSLRGRSPGPGPNLGGRSVLAVVAGFPQAGAEVLAVHLGDELHTDPLGAGGLALVVVGAIAEALPVHLLDHAPHPGGALGLALGQ